MPLYSPEPLKWWKSSEYSLLSQLIHLLFRESLRQLIYSTIDENISNHRNGDKAKESRNDTKGHGVRHPEFRLLSYRGIHPLQGMNQELQREMHLASVWRPRKGIVRRSRCSLRCINNAWHSGYCHKCIWRSCLNACTISHHATILITNIAAWCVANVNSLLKYKAQTVLVIL